MTILKTEMDRRRWVKYLEAQPLPQEVTHRAWKKSRTNEQNALLFGVMYPPIAEKMGYPVDGDNGIHAFMCGTHFGWVDRPVPKTPRNPEGIASFPRRTTTRNELDKRSVLSPAEFSAFIDTVDRIASHAGVYIPMESAA